MTFFATGTSDGADSVGRAETPSEAVMSVWAAALIWLSICWPRYGFIALGGTLKITPFYLLSLFSWLIVPAALLLSTPLRLRFRSSFGQAWPLLAAYLTWFVWRLLTAATGEDPGPSAIIVARELLYFMPLIAAPFLLGHGSRGVRRLLTIVVLSTSIVIAISFFELVSGRSFVQMTGLNFAGDASFLQSMEVITQRSGGNRLRSIFTHSIVLGQYLAFAFPFALVATMYGSRALRAMSYACLISSPIIAWNCGSRAALLAMAFTAGLWWALSMLRRAGQGSRLSTLGLIVGLFVGVATLGASQSALSALVDGRNSIEAGSTAIRRVMVEKAFNEIGHSPVVGFGAGRSPYHAGAYGSGGTLTIDSAYISGLLDTGWLGLALQMVAWGGTFLTACAVAIRRDSPPAMSAVAAGAAGVILVFSVLSISDNLTLLLLASGCLTLALPARKSPRTQLPARLRN